jgi:Flp pilus assembly pilin Flp
MSRDQVSLQSEAGQTMAEYSVVLGVITLAIVTTLSLLSGAIAAAFGRTVDIVSSIVT